MKMQGDGTGRIERSIKIYKDLTHVGFLPRKGTILLGKRSRKERITTAHISNR